MLKNLKVMMAIKNISNKKLSEISGVSEKHISKLRNDKNVNASITTVEKLAKALEVEVTELL